MITTTQGLQGSFPHFAEVLWKSSVYFKWLIKHRYVLFNDDNIDSS